MLFLLVPLASNHVIDVYHNYKRHGIESFNLIIHQNVYQIEYKDADYFLSHDLKELKGYQLRNIEQRIYPLDELILRKLFRKIINKKLKKQT